MFTKSFDQIMGTFAKAQKELAELISRRDKEMKALNKAVLIAQIERDKADNAKKQIDKLFTK